jgi:dipeptide/tripeptide permease
MKWAQRNSSSIDTSAVSHWLDLAAVAGVEEADIVNAKSLLNILPVLAVLPAFWMLFDQQGSVWLLQTKEMQLPGYIEPEQLGLVNAVCVLVLIPLLDTCVYPVVDRWCVHPALILLSSHPAITPSCARSLSQ